MTGRRRPLPNRFIEYVVRPPALLVFAILGGIYKVLFAWWLGPWMVYLGDKKLKEEIQQSVPSLFAEHGGRFVPNPQEPSKGSASVTVLAGGIVFQFNRWRDELTVKVAPETKPNELHELTALVKSSNRFRASQRPTQYFTLGQFARFLEEYFETIRLEMRDRSGPRAES
jgi:hypothetical protein